MTENGSSPYSLRDLPLPAKLVISAFLIAVGVGYFSALVQLHMQHSDRDGTAMPPVENVIAVFAGKKWQADDGSVPIIIGRLEELIAGPAKGEITGKNMAPAFFAHDGADYEKLALEKPAQLADLDAHREGERGAVLAWIRTAPEGRKKSYDDDAFVMPAHLAGMPITVGYKAEGPAIKIRSLLDNRCARCHQAGGEKSDVPLQTYEDFAKYIPLKIPVPPGGGWIDSGRQMSLEKLTQSTHAHLLSFAVLFSLTGLTFAFTSYPVWLRCILGPMVLIAQFADVSCWWLARLEPMGLYFAKTIIATGGVVGLGLVLQIVLGLFNMYHLRGKFVVLLLMAMGAGLGGVTYVKVIGPHLEKEKREKDELKAKPTPPEKTAASSNGPTRLEQLLVWNKKLPDGTLVLASHLYDKSPDIIPWKGKDDGMMARAFFDKDDGSFKKSKGDERKSLIAEREGERLAMLAWIRSAADVRKIAYDDDAFELPSILKDPITEDYKTPKGVKLKSLVNDRCARCHAVGAEKEDKLLDSYQGLMKYLVPLAK